MNLSIIRSNNIFSLISFYPRMALMRGFFILNKKQEFFLNGLRQDILSIINTAINAVKPASVIPEAIKLSGDRLEAGGKVFDLQACSSLYVIAAGKASAYMAAEMETILGSRISGGIAVTKYGHTKPLRRIKLIEAAHPLPDEKSLYAGDKILTLAKGLSEKDLVLLLLSGGASSLMEKLPAGLTLADLQTTVDLLLKGGAGIDELNCVRKQLSLIKGGRLAEAVFPANLLSLIISDVIGDKLDVIASGPSVRNTSTPADALEILTHFDSSRAVPNSIYEYLAKETESGQQREASIDDDANIIIANNERALSAAAEKAKQTGYITIKAYENISGEAREAALYIAEQMIRAGKEAEPGERISLLFGGETTVTVKGKGKGGRNQELILALLNELKDFNFDFAAASIGTDGTDGPTDAAGGIITGDTSEKVRQLKFPIDDYLNNNNSYEALQELNALHITGPTGTNVMDIIICLIIPKA